METFLSKILILDNMEKEKNISRTTTLQNNFSDTSTKIKNGYGACKADGCRCNGYKPNDPKNDYCRVCGHHWTRHW